MQSPVWPGREACLEARARPQSDKALPLHIRRRRQAQPPQLRQPLHPEPSPQSHALGITCSATTSAHSDAEAARASDSCVSLPAYFCWLFAAFFPAHTRTAAENVPIDPVVTISVPCCS